MNIVIPRTSTPPPTRTCSPFLLSLLRKHASQTALEEALDSTTLGDLWFERGELKEARYEHQRALEIRTARLPTGHPDVAESLESLGNVAIREVSFGSRERRLRRVSVSVCCCWLSH